MVRICQHLTQPTSWRTKLCLPSAATHAIYSQLPSVLKVVPPSATWGSPMSWWQGPTYHWCNWSSRRNSTAHLRTLTIPLDPHHLRNKDYEIIFHISFVSSSYHTWLPTKNTHKLRTQASYVNLLFYDSASKTSVEMQTNELWVKIIWKEKVVSWSTYCLGMCLDNMTKIRKTLRIASVDSRTQEYVFINRVHNIWITTTYII
jgi:hypothetical protein